MLESTRGAGINDRDIECIQLNTSVMMPEMFTLRFHLPLYVPCFPDPRVKEKSYYIQSSFRRITYVAVSDAQLPDELIVQRL